MRVLLLEALEVQLTAGLDSDELSSEEKFSWEVLSFEQDLIKLQIKFKNPERVAFMAQNFIKVTFWGVELFKSQEGVEV